jgi:O-antigen/teichoic acid export membrane protein
MSAISTTIGGDTSAKSHELPRTRLSLYYLVGYTLPVGVALMFVPQMTMNLLLTNHAYDDLGLRMFGVLLFSLGMIASGMIITKASDVYPGTLFVRGFIIAALFVLYSQYGDPALLAINLVVTVGWALTFLSWRKDKAEERG